MNIDELYDTKLKTVLETRLKRAASAQEVINADTDSDLVTETLWQLLVALDERVKILEENSVIIKKT